MVRRKDFLPLELMAAKAGFALSPMGSPLRVVKGKRSPRAAA